MSVKAILQRRYEYSKIPQPDGSVEDVTIGELFVENDNGEVLFKCYTLENGGPSTDESGKDKRIMPRTYKLKWHSSSKNKGLAVKYPEFKNKDGRNKAIHLYTDELPSFEKRYILIHSGNYAKDTLGCILLGKTAGEGAIYYSIDATANFYKFVRDKLDINTLTLEVREKEVIE